ncbi:MAG: hypothetical protein NVSMB39_3570 [Candidatus Saccharimonadales bacterium]
MKLSECSNPDEIQEALREMWADPQQADLQPIIDYWRTNQDIEVIYQTLLFKRQFLAKLRSYVSVSLRHHPEQQEAFAWMAQQLEEG